jgi:hypothetical protein
MGAALPVVSLAASVVGAGVSAFGQLRAGQAQAASAQAGAQAAASQYRYQAAVADINRRTAERNARVADTNAAYVEAAGARLADDRARRIRQTIGAQRAALAANGLLLDEGSAADMQGDTASLGRMALTEIGDNARRQAAGYRIAGVNARDEAEAATLRGEGYRASSTNALAAGAFAADNASTAGWLGATSSLLGGATSTFDRWADMRRSGVAMTQPPVVT